MNIEMTFEQAYQRLKEIHDQIQSTQFIPVDQLVALQEEAKKCADLCQRTLKKYSTLEKN